MNTPPPKKRLGRGLAALIGDDSPNHTHEADPRQLRHLPIEKMHASSRNPRKVFAAEDLEELSRSIKDKGMLQPILVRHLLNDEYEIVAGERRWRAAQQAGIHEVPVLVKNLNDGEALEIALIENIQRSELNPLEEAQAYSQLLEQFSYTQQQLADSVGKSRSHVANLLRLLNLPDSVRKLIVDGELSAGHARALVATESPATLAQKIIKLGLSVRDAEQLARKAAPTSKKPKAGKTADARALEKAVGESLGLAIDITNHDGEGGTITIIYNNMDQLEEVCRRLQSRQGLKDS